MEKRLSFTTINFGVAFCFRLLQCICLLTVLVLFFQGKGAHGVFLLIAALVPLLRWVSSSRYRSSVALMSARAWDAIVQFSIDKKQLPWKQSGLFVALPFLVFALANGGTQSSGDNLPSWMVAHSLVSEGNTELSEFVRPNEPYYFLRKLPQGNYSAYPLGMSVFALPVMAIARLVSADLYQDAKAGLRLEKWTASLVSALSLVFFFFIALHLSDAKTAWVVSLLVGLTSGFLSTLGQGLWSQGGVVFGTLGFLLLEFRYLEKRCALPLCVGLQGACLALMYCCRLSSAVLIAPFLLWLLVRDLRRGCFTGLSAALWYLPLALYYWSLYGSPLGPQFMMAGQNYWTVNFLPGFLGILFSPGRGLFVYQCWLLLVLGAFVPSCFVAFKRTQSMYAHWGTVVFAAIVLHIAIISCWKIWDGGYCWGSRLLLEVVPLMALFILPVVTLLLQSRVGKGFLWAVALLSFLTHANAVYHLAGFWQGDPLIGSTLGPHERLWDWSDPPFLYPFLR